MRFFRYRLLLAVFWRDGGIAKWIARTPLSRLFLLFLRTATDRGKLIRIIQNTNYPYSRLSGSPYPYKEDENSQKTSISYLEF